VTDALARRDHLELVVQHLAVELVVAVVVVATGAARDRRAAAASGPGEARAGRDLLLLDQDLSALVDGRTPDLGAGQLAVALAERDDVAILVERDARIDRVVRAERDHRAGAREVGRVRAQRDLLARTLDGVEDEAERLLTLGELRLSPGR